jgi:hypothetical protein
MKIYNITLLDDESDITLNELPVKFVYKDSKILGIVTLVLGCIFLLLPLAHLIKTLLSGFAISKALPVLAVSAIAIPLFFLGLNMVKKRKEIIISREWISKSNHSLFNKEEWKESVTSYDGILMRTDIQAPGEQNSTLIFALDFLHKEEAKTIRLFRSMEFNAAFSRWKEYCTLFDCPALERVSRDRIITRRLKELSIPLVDLVKNGSVELFDPDSPPAMPPSVKVETGPKGETIMLPDETMFIIGEKNVSINQKITWKSQNKYEFSAVKSILIDYMKSHKKWGWSLVILERGSTHRSIYAHDIPYEILEWLQYRLISEIVKKSE